MSDRNNLSLRKARQQTPAQALGEWTLSLREAAYDAITEADITAIMRAQVEKAKAGDAKAAQFVLDYFTKLPVTTISVGLRGATVEREAAAPIVPAVVVGRANGKPALNGNGKRRPGEPTDEELDAQIEAEDSRHPLWKPSPYVPADPRHNAIVDARAAAGLPARHPADPQPDLE